MIIGMPGSTHRTAETRERIAAGVRARAERRRDIERGFREAVALLRMLAPLLHKCAADGDPTAAYAIGVLKDAGLIA